MDKSACQFHSCIWPRGTILAHADPRHMFGVYFGETAAAAARGDLRLGDEAAARKSSIFFCATSISGLSSLTRTKSSFFSASRFSVFKLASWASSFFNLAVRSRSRAALSVSTSGIRSLGWAIHSGGRA